MGRQCTNAEIYTVSHSSQKRCREVTRRLYTALVAYYTGFFYTPKSLNLELDLSRARMPVELKYELSALFQSILDNRVDFCKFVPIGTIALIPIILDMC